MGTTDFHLLPPVPMIRRLQVENLDDGVSGVAFGYSNQIGAALLLAPLVKVLKGNW